MMTRFSSWRRWLHTTSLTAILALGVGAHSAMADPGPQQLRIGYQKGSVSLVLAKSHRLLEQRFPDTKISWTEFPAGPQMLEALNVGSIDVGSTGDIPPIFAQAAGADLLYVGVEPPKPKAEVILVPENSPIHDVAELKGHKVAFQKGSSSHNLLLRALQQAGLKFTDIQPVYLTRQTPAPPSSRVTSTLGRFGIPTTLRRCCRAACGCSPTAASSTRPARFIWPPGRIPKPTARLFSRC